MKNWAFEVVLLLTLGVATGMATTIDFSACTAGSITAAGGVDCGGVNFVFDVLGTTNTATIGSTGLVMNANGDAAGFLGELDLTFAVPADSITFDFVIGPTGSLAANGFGLLVVLNNGIDNMATDPTTCTVVGLNCGGTVSFAPASAPFNVADVTPNPDATSLTISSLSFTDASAPTVPEPGTYALFGSGLLLLGFGSRKPIKRRS